MITATSLQRIELRHDGYTRLEDACGARIDCQAGTLWITVDGEFDDVVLSPGESYTVHSTAPVIAQAILGPSSLSVEEGAVPCH